MTKAIVTLQHPFDSVMSSDSKMFLPGKKIEEMYFLDQKLFNTEKEGLKKRPLCFPQALQIRYHMLHVQGVFQNTFEILLFSIFLNARNLI